MAKTYFDQITASPAVLAEFLASIPALETPWDEAFQRTYCAACSAENCDAENCPHQAERGNPAWWLKQTAEATPSDKDVTPRPRFKGLAEMTDEEINEFARRFYLAIQSMREAKHQQQRNL